MENKLGVLLGCLGLATIALGAVAGSDLMPKATITGLHAAVLLDLAHPGRTDGRIQMPELARPVYQPTKVSAQQARYFSYKVPRPPHVRGIYLTGWIAGIPTRFNQLVKLEDETELNTMVIDVKDDEGTLSSKMNVPLAKEIGSGMSKVADMASVLATLKQHNIYSIARVVTFKDPVLAKARPDLAVCDASGRLWHDRAGFLWANPYSKAVWDYNIAIAKEAARMGFSEIQFDYVRFPDVPKSLLLDFPGRDGRSKAQVIRDFLTYARKQLEPYHVKVSADIFGLVTTVKDDMGIGQHFEDLAGAVDYVSPMDYPSHYARGEFGLSDPDAVPYETVYKSLHDAERRLQAAKMPQNLVPWLQDFSLRHSYGVSEVQAQVKAAADLGIRDWYLWNPRNRYTEAALRRE